MNASDPQDQTWPFKYHFFVSYSAREPETAYLKEVISDYVDGLKQLGYLAWPFWFDLHEIGLWRGTAAALRNELAKSIDESIAMVSFISPGYLESDFCSFEWEYMRRTSPHARTFQIPIVWKAITKGMPCKIPDIFHRDHIYITEFDYATYAIKMTVHFLEECRLHRQERWDHRKEVIGWSP
jgi:TIR domain